MMNLPEAGNSSLWATQGLGGLLNLNLEFTEISTLQNSQSLYEEVCSHPQPQSVQAADGPNLHAPRFHLAHDPCKYFYLYFT